MKRRVVVTGLGALTPLGNSLEESWAGAIAGKSGIAAITRFDAAAFASRIAGEVKNFDPTQYVDKKEVRRYDNFAIYALAAAQMLMQDAALTITPDIARRVGVLIGTGMGGIQSLEDEVNVLSQAGPRKVSPFAVPAIVPNLGSGHVSIRFGLKGPNHSVVTACSTGAHAIGDAADNGIAEARPLMHGDIAARHPGRDRERLRRQSGGEGDEDGKGNGAHGWSRDGSEHAVAQLCGAAKARRGAARPEGVTVARWKAAFAPRA